MADISWTSCPAWLPAPSRRRAAFPSRPRARQNRIRFTGIPAAFHAKPAAREGSKAARDFGFQGKIAREPVPEGAASRFAFMGYGQMEARAENRISLDPGKRDRWGVPAAHIRCAMSDGDRNLLIAQEQMLEKLVTDAGGAFEYIGSPLGLREMGRGALPNANPLTRLMFRTFFLQTMRMGSAIHESGGARMGSDPRTSVTDGWGRVWDAPNVCVTDASTFPSSGIAGTTLTVMAQTVRACRQLATELGVSNPQTAG